jgi:hypothetical protein
MRHFLLALFTAVIFFCFVLNGNAQQTLTLKIVETHKDGETSISFDDGEFENDSIDKVNDDDLDMGWEGEDLNVMTTYTRFQNVTIPQGAIIDSAVLVIYAHEDESAEARVTVYAEAADNSAMFSENEAITDRTWTNTSVRWIIDEDWTMWQPYHSPNLASVIQEVINRPGWQPENALTLFMQGEDQGASLLDNARDFESFENIEDPDDGGDGLHHPERIPMLKIYYQNIISGVEKMKENIASSSLKIYPNPVHSGFINLINDAETINRVLLFNLNGQVMKDVMINSRTVRINVSDLQNGIYILRIALENETINQKIIIN